MPLEENKYYLPSSVLKNFITVLWNNATATGKIKGAAVDDPDFRRSIEQIDLREKVISCYVVDTHAYHQPTDPPSRFAVGRIEAVDTS